jgi:hypothetical protein
MNPSYVYLCGVMWRNYQSDDARSELLRALDAEDPDVAWLAYAMLAKQTAQA